MDVVFKHLQEFQCKARVLVFLVGESLFQFLVLFKHIISQLLGIQTKGVIVAVFQDIIAVDGYLQIVVVNGGIINQVESNPGCRF